MLIRDVAVPRKEVLKGEIFGFIKLYNIFEKGPESLPSYIFSITYPSKEIRNVVQAVFEKLNGKRAQGTFVFSGGYGTGKSHLLLVMHHLFRNPKEGRNWLAKNEMAFDLPSDAKVILLPLTDITPVPTYLWEPIFDDLGKSGLIKGVQYHPSTSTIKRALGDRTVVIIFDELESWYDGLGDNAIKHRNLNFLQNLTEISKKNSNLLLFVSLYGLNKELMGRISRVEPYFINLATSRERPNVVLFRLFESIDRKNGGKIVNDYIDSYKHVEMPMEDLHKYRDKMVAYYPIHPELMDILFERYSSSSNYQNTRGVLYLLSSIIKREYVSKDMILASDVDSEGEEGELSQVDRELVEKCIADIERNKTKYARQILNTILLYSLGEVKTKGATKEDLILGILRPSDNINDLLTSLSELNAWNLWDVDGRYVIRPEENILVRIQSEARRAVEEGKTEYALEKIADTIKRDKSFFVYPIEVIPDDKKVKVVVSLKDLTQNEMEGFFRGRGYRNAIIMVEPKKIVDISKNEDLLTIAQRILICEEIEKEVKDETRKLVSDQLRRDKRELAVRLNDFYGSWIKFIRIKKKIEGRRISCNLKEVKAKVRESYDIETIKTEIIESLGGKESGVEADDLLEDFYTILGKPLIFSRSTFGDAIINEAKKGKIVVSKSGKVYDEKNLPRKIENSMVVILKEYYRPPPTIIKEKKAGRTEVQPQLAREKETPSGEEVEVGAPKVSDITVELKPLIEIETEAYRTPYRLAGEFERKLSDNDKIKSVEFSVVAKLRDVKELNEFIKELKIGNAKFKLKIDANIADVLTKADLIRLMDQLPIPEEGVMKAKLKVARE